MATPRAMRVSSRWDSSSSRSPSSCFFAVVSGAEAHMAPSCLILLSLPSAAGPVVPGSDTPAYARGDKDVFHSPAGQHVTPKRSFGRGGKSEIEFAFTQVT